MAKGKFVQSLVKAAEKAGLLDMSEAARMARARELGFDTDNVFYHGTDVDFDAFDISQRGRNFDDQASNTGFFFTSSRDGAEQYGDKIKEVYLKDKGLRVEEISDSDIEAATQEWLDELADSDPDAYDYMMATKQHQNSGEINKGFEMAIMDKFRTGAGAVKYTDDYGETWVLMKDPKNIRSTRAAFDPAKKDSPNLLASILPAAVGVGGAAAMMGQSESAQAMPEPKGKFAKSLMDTYLKQQVAKPMNPSERLQYGQGFGMQDKIEPVQNDWAAKAAEYSDRYNKWRRENVHPIADLALPVGELPADVFRKMSYGDKVKYMDSVMAGLGML